MTGYRPTVALSLVIAMSLGAAQKPAPKRLAKDVEADITASFSRLELKHYPGDALNPIYRQSMTADALPELTQREVLLNELADLTPAPQKPQIRWRLAVNEAKLAFYGDASGKEAIEKREASTDAVEATDGKLARQLMAWWEGSEKPDEQAKALEAVSAIATEQPNNNDVANTLGNMLHNNASTSELSSKAWDVIATMKSPLAVKMNATPNKVGRPLVVAGQTLTGQAFKSDKWKGKVVLVDFWATWCPPCREELPKIAKLYADYHDKGLEIIGVSSDQDRRELAAFLKAHPEMPWPQLFAGGAAWHPLTKKFEITGIPTLYLIDQQGVLVTTNGRAEAEALVPKLLGIESTNTPPTIPGQ